MKKILALLVLSLGSMNSFSKDEPYYFAQSITITIDDVADPNAIPDLLNAINYPGGGNAAAKAAFLKAYIVAHLQARIRDYRKTVAANVAESANANIPIN